MLKRFIVLTVLLLYLSSIAGIRLQAHYCHGTFSEYSFNPFYELTCGCADEQTEMNCCDEAQLLLKIQDSHSSSVSKQLPDLAIVHFLNYSISSGFLPVYSKALSFDCVAEMQDLPPPDCLLSFGQFRI